MNQPDAVDILLAEDNPHDIELIIRALRKPNLVKRLFVAEDGAEALDFLLSRGKFEGREGFRQPKVVLLDIKLPKVDGLEVLRALKADERTRRIPVVMVTSSREDPDLKAAYELGANSYVVKPVEYEQFQEAMSRISQYWLSINQTSA